MKNKKEDNVYRVMLEDEWEEFKKNKKFFGNKLDTQSGFIHLSTKGQLKKTIDKYYKKENSFVILEFATVDFKKKLKWEISRDNQLFPHLYGFIDYFNVKKVKLTNKIL